LKVNGVDLNVKVQGDKTPLIWAHGLMSSMALEDATGWFEWERILGTARLIRYDARGHGLSEGSYSPEDYRWFNLAKDMIAIADNLDLETFVAGGQSMGCATSLYAALAGPRRVSALLLVNPPTAWETRPAQAAIYDQLAGLVEEQGVAVLVDLMKQQPLLPGWLLQAQPELEEGHLEVVRAFHGKVLLLVLRGAKLCDLPPRRELRRLKMPALILAWVDDATHPLAVAEELDALLPASRLEIARNREDLRTWPQLIHGFVASLG
jgi:3-oxoadipate enol-lactonase